MTLKTTYRKLLFLLLCTVYLIGAFPRLSFETLHMVEHMIEGTPLNHHMATHQDDHQHEVLATVLNDFRQQKEQQTSNSKDHQIKKINHFYTPTAQLTISTFSGSQLIDAKPNYYSFHNPEPANPPPKPRKYT